jgi:hypothetical protein
VVRQLPLQQVVMQVRLLRRPLQLPQLRKLVQA